MCETYHIHKEGVMEEGKIDNGPWRLSKTYTDWK